MTAARLVTSIGTLTALCVAHACTPGSHPVEPVPPEATAAQATSPPSASKQKPAPRPTSAPVVVSIVVDQLAAWLAHDRLSALPNQGGFARLLREGTYVVDLRYAHAITDTAPGHAALYTGVAPRQSGVFGNASLDPITGKSLSILHDPSTKLVREAGLDTRVGASAERLGVETVADVLRAAHPDALIVSISMKDRAAIFGGGKHPDASLWFDSSTEGFVSSTAFGDSLPAWARGHEQPAAKASVWEPLDRGWLEAHATEPDAAAGEGALPPPKASAASTGERANVKMTSSFPHVIATAPVPELAFRVSPAGDHEVVELALSAVAALPVGEKPTLLALSLSSADYIGHVYGPDSWEWWDNLLRLDAELARLFGALDTKLGPEGYAVLVTSDHGVGVLPETARDPKARPWCSSPPDRFDRSCVPGGRLWLEQLVPKLERKAGQVLGKGPWLLGASNPYVYLSEAGRALTGERRTRLLQTLQKALEAEQGVASVMVRPSPLPECPAPSDESLEALVCRSLTETSGELYVLMKPGWFLDTGYVPDQGVNHGSPRIHDRSVPLLARAPSRVRSGRVLDAPQSFATFTHTLSALLRIAPPRSAYAGTSLTE
jgi:predicted AlkP superfamily pyrophosphatase or phosphodiesterase